jgi:hypothetical protein
MKPLGKEKKYLACTCRFCAGKAMGGRAFEKRRGENIVDEQLASEEPMKQYGSPQGNGFDSDKMHVALIAREVEKRLGNMIMEEQLETMEPDPVPECEESEGEIGELVEDPDDALLDELAEEIRVQERIELAKNSGAYGRPDNDQYQRVRMLRRCHERIRYG